LYLNSFVEPQRLLQGSPEVLQLPHRPFSSHVLTPSHSPEPHDWVSPGLQTPQQHLLPSSQLATSSEPSGQPNGASITRPVLPFSL